MRFYTNPHPFSCGIDLHARSRYVCLMSHDGEILLHRHRQAAPEPLLQALAPSRAGLVVAVAGLFTWYGLADLCADAGLAFVLAHARSLKAIHGGKAKHDKSDAPKIAALLRGGLLPPASVSPAELRATRDLVRRRTHLRRQRAALLAHVQTTNSQANLPALGKHIAYKAHRRGVAARFDDAAVHKNVAVARALIPYDDALRTALALSIVNTAKQHAAPTFYRLRSIPGVGTSLALVMLDAIHALRRFPRVQDVVAYCRRGKCARAAAGKRSGSAGTTIGHAHLTWAFAAAAVLCLRHHPPGQTYLAR